MISDVPHHCHHLYISFEDIFVSLSFLRKNKLSLLSLCICALLGFVIDLLTAFGKKCTSLKIFRKRKKRNARKSN